MLAAVRQPKGLKKLVLADSLSDVLLFIKGVKRLREALPQDIQDEMKKREDAGTTEGEEREVCGFLLCEAHHKNGSYAQWFCR
jgi:hypothetical protein